MKTTTKMGSNRYCRTSLRKRSKLPHPINAGGLTSKCLSSCNHLNGNFVKPILRLPVKRICMYARLKTQAWCSSDGKRIMSKKTPSRLNFVWRLVGFLPMLFLVHQTQTFTIRNAPLIHTSSIKALAVELMSMVGSPTILLSSIRVANVMRFRRI